MRLLIELMTGLLVVALGAQIVLRSLHSRALPRYTQGFFSISVLITLLVRIGLARIQYRAWQEGSLSRLLLPPYESWTYFAAYIGWRLFVPWLIALATGLIAIYAARLLNRRRGGMFFEEEEPWFFGLAVFLTGYPICVFYIAILAVTALLWTAFFNLRTGDRAPLYYLWFPVALVAILIVYRYVPPAVLAQFNL